MANQGKAVMTDMGICACPGCEHQVSSKQAVTAEGHVYCCTPCAAGHPEGRECIHVGCPCTDLNRSAEDDESAGEEIMEKFSNAQF